MDTSLDDDALHTVTDSLAAANGAFMNRYPGETGRRQPVHTVYGGAHLFRADAAHKLGQHALRSLDEHAPDAKAFARALGLSDASSDRVYARVREKLGREAVEDFRIDFEDGYGNRSDAEEDGHAASAAKEVARGLASRTLPPFIGIRIKPLTEELRARSVRTLDGFLTTLLAESGGKLPDNFVVTLPKVQIPEHVSALASFFDILEPRLELPAGALKLELMIEQTQAIVGADGRVVLPTLLDAARGRCVAAHFGTYDYTASCNITAAHQHMMHPACDFALQMMIVSYAGTGIWLSNGATNVMPVGATDVVHRAWKLAFDHIQHSLVLGLYQGWDLHPAQLPVRYAAVYAFFLESLDAASTRLRNFVEKAAQATLVADVFDDAATGQGLLNYFLRGINCGGITEREAQELTSLTEDEIRSRSFVKILKGRRAV